MGLHYKDFIKLLSLDPFLVRLDLHNILEETKRRVRTAVNRNSCSFVTRKSDFKMPQVRPKSDAREYLTRVKASPSF